MNGVARMLRKRSGPYEQSDTLSYCSLLLVMMLPARAVQQVQSERNGRIDQCTDISIERAKRIQTPQNATDSFKKL